MGHGWWTLALWLLVSCWALLSPDVNECELYGQEGRPRLCMHACVNTPGSYRCACPSGYRTLADGKSCEGERDCGRGIWSHVIALNYWGRRREGRGLL